jgi:hypothetical protein
MRCRWQKLIEAVDPDVLIGYNILNFDFPYLVTRAQTLQIPAFLQWGRVRNTPLKMRDAQFSSKAYGTHAYKDITIEGRVQFDLLTAIQRDHKLSSYSLNSVSAHFLGALLPPPVCSTVHSISQKSFPRPDMMRILIPISGIAVNVSTLSLLNANDLLLLSIKSFSRSQPP